MYHFLLAIVSIALSCTGFEIKRDVLFENRNFYHITLHLTPSLWMSPSEYCHAVCYAKTRMVWLPDSEKKFEHMFSRFDTIPACVRQTDGRTDILR